MMNWNFDPSEYEAREFTLIPEGDHKVRIDSVEEKVFSSGNEGFEIMLDVSGFNSKLWYYLVLDPREKAKTNQRLGMFFDSFDIHDFNLSNYNNWVGRDGAVRVKHNLYNGSKTANVVFCLSRKQQEKFVVQRTNPYVAPKPTTNERPHREFNGFSF